MIYSAGKSVFKKFFTYTFCFVYRRLDINECQINNHDCLESQRCDNTIGSYTCIRLQSCGTGYTLNAATGYCDGKLQHIVSNLFS